jgi:GTP pyrophosphokinase
MADQVLTPAAQRHHDLFEELLAEVAEYNPDVDRELLERAFVFASERHEGQQRRSGEDFILHPLGVARILAELGRDDATLARALWLTTSSRTRTPRSRKSVRGSARKWPTSSKGSRS